MERTYTIKYNARDLLSQLISSPFRKKKIHRVTSVPTNLYASFICASRIYEL